MNRRQKIIVSITGIFLVLLILVGLTYAYFLTRIQGNTNPKSISVTTADLKLVYGDGTATLVTKDNIIPGDTVGTKDFTVTNEGDTETEYVVVLDNIKITKKEGGTTTTFNSNDFVYELTCSGKITNDSDETTSECNGVSGETTLPLTDDGILIGNKIAVDEVQTYNLTVKYKETGLDQSEDMGKKLEAKVDIKNFRDINPYEEGTLAYNIINNAMTNKNGTELRAVPLSVPGKEISEYKTGNLVYEQIKIDQLPDGYSNWAVADVCAAASGSAGKRVSSYEEAVGKCVYNIDESWTKRLLKYDKDTNTLTFDNKVEEILPEKTLSTTTDDYGTSYYFRGAVDDNYVNFISMCWRIVRIQGDGSVKLILASEEGCSSTDLTANSGYATDKENTIIQTHYGYKEINTNKVNDYKYSAADSENGAKNKLNDWLKRKIGNEESSNYKKIKTEKWCIGDLKNAYSYSGTGDIVGTVTEYINSKTNFYYAASNRLDYLKTPKMKCETTGVDGEIDENKIGMLTIDEVAFAGGGNANNSSYYLNKNSTGYNWLTLSPYYFDYNCDLVYNVGVDGGGYIKGNNLDVNSFTLRPVVILNANITISGGDGTLERPYIIAD